MARPGCRQHGRTAAGGDTARWGDNVQFALARFDLVHKFAYVQEITPAIKPYYYGSTYSYFLYAWIPRLLWPAKPSAAQANEQLDVDYRLKAPEQGSTIGIGQLPEAYVNFGLLGIILVMSIQGFVFALLDSSLNGPRSEGAGHLPIGDGLLPQRHRLFSGHPLWRVVPADPGQCSDSPSVCNWLAGWGWG